jgi:predicted ATPase with chaperone activity
LAETSLTCNADMRPAEIRHTCTLDDTCRSLMKTAMNQLQLSARAYHRILKLARTIADLAGAEAIQPPTWLKPFSIVPGCKKKIDPGLNQILFAL